MSRGASRLATALADPNLTTPPRYITIPAFDSEGEWEFTDKDGIRRFYSTRVFTCRYCGDSLPAVIVCVTEERATYHRASEGVLIENDPGCPACAAILVPTPLFVQVGGWAVLFKEVRDCCVIARIRKYADALWSKDHTYLSDQWEAWAARLAKNNGIIVPRDHNPDTCENDWRHLP